MDRGTQNLPITDEDLSRFLAYLPDATLLCDPLGAVLASNKKAAAIFAGTGPFPKHMFTVVPDIEDWDPEGLQSMSEAGELEATFPYPPIQPAGNPALSLSIRSSVIRNKAGAFRVLVSIRDLSAEHKTEERLRELSMTDELTGIPNRRFLASTLAFEEERARRFGRMLFVMFLDIDKFKMINDLFGHPVGDRAIRHFASTMAESIRKIDTVCRWGGDEFVVIGLCTTTDGALTLLHRLLKAMDGNPLLVDEDIIPLKASVGMVLARYGPDSRMYGDALIAEADALMLKVKEREDTQYLVGEMGPDTRHASL